MHFTAVYVCHVYIMISLTSDNLQNQINQHSQSRLSLINLTNVDSNVLMNNIPEYANFRLITKPD